MEPREGEAVLALCLMAAYADGTKSAAERETVRRIVDTVGAELSPALTHSVLMKTLSLQEATSRLQTPEARSLAYEMIVHVCEADGPSNEAERMFLRRVEEAFALPATTSTEVRQTSTALVAAPVDDSTPALRIEPGAEVNVDDMILRYAILTGALELLPQSLATLAVIPFQMRMVYRIGKAHGVTLDRGHLAEFLATIGVGMTGQFVEGFARKALGQLARRIGGGIFGTIAGTATSAGLTFGITYAIGQVAKAYYAGGRKLSADDLRNLFGRMLQEGKDLFARHQTDIQQRAGTLSMADIMPLIKHGIR